MPDARMPPPDPGRCPDCGQPVPEPALAPVPKTWPLRYLGLLAALSLAVRFLLRHFAGGTVSGNLLPLSVLFACALLASGFAYRLIGSLKRGRDTRLLLRMTFLNMGCFVVLAVFTVLRAVLT
ncbi:MAG: hypothetical protein GXX99_06495 [Clostridiales bacterium]|nr:hypothetical protein [Clostridiales bacterium]